LEHSLDIKGRYKLQPKSRFRRLNKNNLLSSYKPEKNNNERASSTTQ
jgi:hypothetical protein